MSVALSLVLDLSRANECLAVGLTEYGATVQAYENLPVDWQEISLISSAMIALLEKSSEIGTLAAGVGADLKKSGRLLYEKLLTPAIKKRLRAAPALDLTLQIDEQLVFIPWELLFDGEEYLCLRFSLGRCVKTRRKLQHISPPAPTPPLRMLIIADPKGDLPAAADEAGRIRQELSGVSSLVLTSKCRNVHRRYLSRNIHECDILHYAGHAEFDPQDPLNSGWLFADGKMTARDLADLGAAVPLPYVIFMNACRSAFPGAGGSNSGQEHQLFGLADILLSAGARYVIGAICRIPDEAALKLSYSFYRSLAAGQSVGAAFLNARREIRAGGREDDLSWAGYILYGVPSGWLVNPQGPAQGGSSAKGQVDGWTRSPAMRAFLMLVCGGLAWACWAGAGHWFSQEKANKSIRLAEKELAAGRDELAIKQYEAALAAVPGHVQAALELARVYGRLQEHVKAQAVLRTALSSFRGKGPGNAKLRDHLLRALASQTAALEHYDATQKWLQGLLPGQKADPAQLVELYELIGQVAALDGDYVAASDWFSKARRLCRERSLEPALLRVILSQADNNWEAQVAGGISTGQKKPRDLEALQKVINLYEEAGELALRQKDIVAQAQVAQGRARVYRFKEDWQRSLDEYRKAIALWGSLPVLSWDEKTRMLNSFLDLAEINVHPKLNFSDAWQALDQFRKLIEPAKGIPAGHAEEVYLLQRKFERFLAQLAARGYKNSDLYKRSVVVYDRFLSLPVIGDTSR